MLRRLFIVLQVICSIPIIIFLFLWFTESRSLPIYSVILFIPYVIIFLVKWIVYGKFHLYKIGEGKLKIHYNKNKPKKPPIVPNEGHSQLTEQEINERT
jgi:hypothetical protein